MFLLRLFVLIFISHAVFAADIPCKPALYTRQDNKIILPGSTIKGTSQLYFIQNISAQGIWIDHPVARRGASAGWASFIRPKNWSVLVVDKKNFAISCAVINPGKVDYEDCGKILSVCMPRELQIDKKHSGSYWLVEDKPWEELPKNVLNRKGVVQQHSSR